MIRKSDLKAEMEYTKSVMNLTSAKLRRVRRLSQYTQAVIRRGVVWFMSLSLAIASLFFALLTVDKLRPLPSLYVVGATGMILSMEAMLLGEVGYLWQLWRENRSAKKELDIIGRENAETNSKLEQLFKLLEKTPED